MTSLKLLYRRPNQVCIATRINCHYAQSGAQIGKFAKCAGDLSFVQIACAAVFVSLNNSSIVSFCCFTKVSRLEPRLKFKVRGREIGRARQTFQSGVVLGAVM